jgi:hypothetical protein
MVTMSFIVKNICGGNCTKMSANMIFFLVATLHLMRSHYWKGKDR